MNKARVGCVLMASGYGKRFGGNKLLECVDGVPMVVRAMRAMPEGLFAARTLVTVYPQVAELAAREGFAPVANPDTQDDPAVTIRLGLAAMPDGLDGCLFSVCDQPWLTAQSVARLVDAFRRGGGPVALGFAGTAGKPGRFPRRAFSRSWRRSSRLRRGAMRLMQAAFPYGWCRPIARASCSMWTGGKICATAWTGMAAFDTIKRILRGGGMVCAF